MSKRWAAAMALAAAVGAQAAPADDIKALLEQGRDKEAWQLGRRHADLWGEPLFDFYFGVAALNAGVPGDGVLALERYLLHAPDHRAALFQLARGYYMLGEDPRAREEFQALLPAAQGAEKDAIQKYLDAIGARESRYRPILSYYAESGAGYDSNVNSGVAAGQVAGLPAGFVVAPGQASEQLGSSLYSLAVGMQGSYPLSARWSAYGGASLAARRHTHDLADVFDSETLALQAGLSHTEGRHLFRLGLDAATLHLDHQHYLDVATLVGEWQYQMDPLNRFGAALQASWQDYHDITSFLDLAKTVPVSSSSEVRDSRVAAGALSWTRGFGGAWNPQVQAALSAARESNRHDRPDLSRDLWGVKLAGALQPAAAWTVTAGLSWQQAKHDDEFAVGIAPREDRLAMADVAAAWTLARHWTLRGEYQHSRQRSTIGLYQFHRNQFLVKLRYDSH